MFSVSDRDRIRDYVLQMAASDTRVVAGAVVGSLALEEGDRWSDLDLTFGVADDMSIFNVLEDWTHSLVTEFDATHLFDLPSGPRPDPATPAPVRFLPEYDNVLLSHDDRSRFVRPEDRDVLAPAWTIGHGSVLVDGIVSAVWRLEPDGLVVSHVPRPKRVLASIAAEGRRLARFLGAPVPDVRLVELSP